MAEDEGQRTCQWCGAVAAANATQCPGCGAALATRESLGGLVVPGVTAVDPALEAYDAQPWRLPRSSPSQGLAGGTIAAAAIGGPAAIAAIGGLAAVAAVEYLGAGQGHGDAPALEDVGRPSEAAVEMARQLDAGGGAAGEQPTNDQEAGPGE
jgi:RNA polymerase subunit RPABC4/transcription elongation factor Spt4